MMKYTIPAGSMLIKFDEAACAEPAAPCVGNDNQNVADSAGKNSMGAETHSRYKSVSSPVLDVAS